MATFYISTTGNDTTGVGSIGNPWRTLFKACQTVNTLGDIIHVNAGTYVETQQCLLAVGVSLEGDGITSILKSTRTALFEPLLYLQSTQGTNGNQSVSFLKFDGTMTVQQGLQVNGRSNVSVHDITMVDFFERGVVFTGALNLPLTNYATGNTFYNNTVVNCGQNNGTGYGCLNIGGQDGMLIYNNTITQNSRADGLNGWPIKYIDEGHLKNVKIYNNTLNKNMQTGLQNYIDWPFVMELFNIEGGVEIYNNTCIGGGIDLVFMTKGASTYSVWVHDNDISCPTLPVATQMGVTGENMEPPNSVNIRDMIIERNIFTNLSLGVYFTARPGAFMDNIVIRNNLMKNHSGISQAGAFINLGENGGATNYTNIDILNNTMIANPSAPFYTGIILPSFCTVGSVINNINIKNNNISGTTAGSIFHQANAVAISNLNISNNNFYNNNNDTDFRTSPAPVNYINANNLHVVPTYNSNFTLPLGSPLIDTGINVGLPYSGLAPDIGYFEYISGGNIAPSANAGTDKIVLQPDTSTTLIGSGIDPDGTIASYAWTQISGASATITSPSASTTTITGLSTLGTRVFRLTVTDNLGAIGTDDVQVTVNPASANQAPIANAGSDQSISTITTSTTLAGSGSDIDGTVVSSLWTKLSGAGTITTPSSYTSTITGLVPGTTLLQLTVTDNLGATGTDTMIISVEDKIYATLNPADKSSNVTLSNGNKSFAASAIASGVRGVYGKTTGKYYYEATINSITLTNSMCIGFANATYNLNTTLGTDVNSWAIGVRSDDSYTINNNSFVGIGTAIAVNDILGFALDLDAGTLSFYINNVLVFNTTAFTGITGTIFPAISTWADATGTATFNFGVSGFTYPKSGYVGWFINGTTPNQPPVSIAGSDQSITLPTNSVTLTGSGTDGDGTIVSYSWSKLSGPAGAGGVITSPSSATTTVTGLIAGIYVFRLTVTDNLGATGFDDIQITVNSSANQPPTANAGINVSITLPTSSVVLSGSGSDVDGTIASYLWTRTSGPNTPTLSGTTTPTLSIGATGTPMVAGTYVYRLTVTDNLGATGFDETQIIVNVSQSTIKRKIVILP